MAAEQAFLGCEDLTQFKLFLNFSRRVDDRIIYKLNRVRHDPQRPARSQAETDGECRAVWRQAADAQALRRRRIEQCVAETDAYVRALAQSDAAPPHELKFERAKLSLLRDESLVEDLLRSRVANLFKARCQAVFYEQRRAERLALLSGGAAGSAGDDGGSAGGGGGASTAVDGRSTSTGL